MKSQIRVDYASRYGEGMFGDKEPIIRADLTESDDPRDTLLHEIFQNESFVNVGSIQRNPGSPSIQKTYVIYRKSESEILCDLASTVFHTLGSYSGIDANLVTSHNEIYFELRGNYQVRSKGVSKSREFHQIEPRFENNPEFIRRLTQDWKDFEKLVKDSQKNSKKNLESGQ